jgi:hypothetical protein
MLDFAPSAIAPDYEYRRTQVKAQDDGTAQWEITFDAIGGLDSESGRSLGNFDRPEQQMLKIVLKGKQIEQDDVPPEILPPSSLFDDAESPGSPYEMAPIYELEIADVQLVERSYTFPDPPKPTFWSKVKYFFGYTTDTPDHIIYHFDNWDSHGRKGTLKNAIGIILYDWKWDFVLIVVAIVIGGLSVLYGIYRLILFIIEQRRLAKWSGMDEVWRQIEDEGDEGDGLLDRGYRDYPDDTSPPPRYTDEVHINKPLPSKPLPAVPSLDKPLPTVPLIDDV